MIRRRANLDEPSPELNAKFIEQFVALPDFWNAGKTASNAPFEFAGESASLDLRTALASGLGEQVSYAPRFAGYLSRDISSVGRLYLVAARYREGGLRPVLFGHAAAAD